MFYELTAEAHIRIPPSSLNRNIKEAVEERLNEEFEGYISQEEGFIICITEVIKTGEGIIIPGDGAAYYKTEFKILTFIPELQELVLGKISDITNFGAFYNMGPTEGMIHVSQTMDDFISFTKQKTLAGKQTKRVLKVGDLCLARIIAISFKEVTNPKIGLTMRQPELGCLAWKKQIKKKKKE